MSEASEREELITRLVDLQEDIVLDLVNRRRAAGDDPLQIIEDCNEYMWQVGLRYERGDDFVAGLIMSGEIFREVDYLVQPRLVSQAPAQSAGRVLIGTVQGDIHDIGKEHDVDAAGMLRLQRDRSGCGCAGRRVRRQSS